MKILFIHEVDFREKVIFEMHEFPELLAERGHEISFIDFPENESLWPPRLTTKREQIQGRVISTIAINLISLPRVFPFPLDRIYNACTSWLTIRKEIRESRPDLIFLYGVPTNGWQSIFLARRNGIPTIYRAIDVSHQIRKSFFSKLIKSAEKYVVKNADLVLTHNASMSEHVTSLGALAEHVTLLFPGVAGFGEEREIQQFEKRDNVVLFMGTLFEFCGVADLVSWISEWQGTASNCEFWILGDGPHKNAVLAMADSTGRTDQLKFFGFVPFHELTERMKVATVAVLPFQEIPLTHNALPGKVAQYINAGLPVVSTRLNGLNSLLSSGQGVVYAAPGEEFVDKLNQLLNDDLLRKEVVEQGMLKLDEVCSWPAVISKIEAIISELLLKNSGQNAK